MCPGIVAHTTTGQLCMEPWLAVSLFPLFGLLLCIGVIFGQRMINFVRQKRHENGGVFWTIMFILTVVLLIGVQILGTLVSIIGILIVATAVISMFTGKK